MRWIVPKAGISLAQAADVLANQRLQLGNVIGASVDVAITADQYVRWNEEAERQLRGAFDDPEIWTSLHSERYWRIRDISADSIRPAALIDQEVQWQQERLAAIANDVEAAGVQLGSAEGCRLMVLDTNILHRYKLINEIPWQVWAGTKAVRLMLPLVVIDELDAQKYGSGSLAVRAAAVIQAIRRMAPITDVPNRYQVRPKVTLQLMSEPPNHLRRPNNDDEIVRQAEVVQRFAGEVLLLTGDLGMQTRATAVGVTSQVLPDDYLDTRRKGTL